jgi:hypothetical protein
MNAEQDRLAQNDRREQLWHLWGPYLSERQWGTVREDYSANGDAWNYFPHEHARSRAYRWGEDGIGGISDFKQRLCFAFAFWNERDPILKERLFGLTNREGNHGEDVKEIFFLEDNTPTHSYMRMTYRYPQAAFPYDQLVRRNAERSKLEPEFELWDTDVLRENRYFDITIEYAKAAPDDLLIRDDHQPRPAGGAAAPPADTLVSQHLELGQGRAPAKLARGRESFRSARGDRGKPSRARRISDDLRGRGAVPLYRQRDQPPVTLRIAKPVALREGRIS